MISEEKKEPYFIQFKKDILEILKKGKYKTGDKIPSENEFCESADVSIRTVRRALLELEKDGIIFRRQGRGSFLRTLETKKENAIKGTICVLFSDIEFITRPSFSTILKGMEAACNKLGYHFNMQAIGMRFGKNINELKALGDVLFMKNINGFIISSPVKKEDIQFLRENNMSFITFHKYKGLNVNALSPVNFELAAEIGIEYLAGCAHKRIGVISGYENTSDEIILGNDIFVKTCAKLISEHGIDAVMRTSDYTEEDGYRIANEMLKLAKPPTAIFAVDDLLAKGAVKAIQEEGLKIPEDIAVLGCNDSLNDSFLSSIRMPLFNHGKFAVEILHSLITKNEKPTAEYTEKPELVLRDSTEINKKRKSA
ncbi:MAG: hypothetical protein A2017_03435 [Lentisphaerae bacterium GWF2_44_16]|nr:MAG: hypothetical protein A2017_03435 [Lentisphaerae bacterium GWF2_44_16]